MLLYGSSNHNNDAQQSPRHHMWLKLTVKPPLPTPSIVSPNSKKPRFFDKDGRKIRVGDCALFEPPHGSPPFIGIIRNLNFDEGNNLILSVNWLYRPSDVKLAKGASFEAAPNEIFYSFHKDRTPAASLLHPCKVAFLRKGVELPPGISSFVCRRVYDIENERLWWLTDKNYIDEIQEEVDQLLDKTQLEMNGAVQAGGRSPKSLNGGPQLKSGPDSLQNNNTSSSSHAKGKNREPRDPKTEDGDSSQSSGLGMLKVKIGKITEKGALVDFEGVERLVHLMQSDKKIDIASRMMLLDVIAATDRYDYLGRFVQLKGLLILDEWLQEVHKGKIGSPKEEGDKSAEEFLFALLRALDKLPVNLHALQTCHVGKSVNNLRSHKNSEIQKKARSLVDTWKKRVEAEMNMNDTKTGSGQVVSWSTKPAPSEVSHVGNKKPGEVNKSSIGQLSSPRNSQSKLGVGEFSKSSLKSLTTSGSITKDSNVRTLSELAQSPIPIKDERSGSSSQSPNNSQCCSSDQARSSATGSASVDRISSCSSRHRRSSNGGLHGSASAKEGKVRSSRNSASEKTALMPNDKQVDAPPVADHGNHQRLIVRLPNTGRSPSRGVNNDLSEDPSTSISRAPPCAEKQDNNQDKKVKSKGDSFHPNTVLNKNADVCNNGKGELAVEPNLSTAGEKCLVGTRCTSTVLRRTEKSSMDVLIESCAKISESNVTDLPGDDDVGMNLLASVAAGEIPKSENASPSGSASPQADEISSGHDEKLRHMVEPSQALVVNGGLTAKQDASLHAKNESNCPPVPTPLHLPGDSNVTSANCEVMVREFGTPSNVPSTNLQQTDKFKPEVKHCELKQDPSTGVCSNVKMEGENDGTGKHGFKRERNSSVITESKTRGTPSRLDEANKVEQVDGTSELSINVQSEACDMSVDEKPSEAIPVCKEVEVKGGAQNSSVVLHKEYDPDKSCDKNSCPLEETKGQTPASDCNNEATNELGKEAVNQCSTKVDIDGDKKEERRSSGPLASESSANSSMALKVDFDFDLNEGFEVEDATASQGEHAKPVELSPLPFPIPSAAGSFPTSITVVVPAKGPFVQLPENPMRSSSDAGWKGSAATSAFRPAEPRKNVESSTSRQDRVPLDFDLNLGLEDEPVQEDAASQPWSRMGGLDLDLNRMDVDTGDVGPLSVGSSSKFEVPPVASRSSGGGNASKGFDLNNGPGLEELSSQMVPPVKSNLPFNGPAPAPGLRMNSADFANLSSWFPRGVSYSGITVPSVWPGRTEHGFVAVAPESHRIIAPPPGEIYRGAVLSSSPAVAYQYPEFPFETTSFPLPSNSYSGNPTAAYLQSSSLCFPSQLVGAAGPFPRPYMMNLPSGTTGPFTSENRNWGSHPLDLNAGPTAATETERRDGRLPATSRQQISVPSSQSLAAEEQIRMFQIPGGVLKRKEPDAGFDGSDRFSYRHSPSPWM
ncbi:hypothetical protein ACFE04_010609 [Oxalis oulophora]